MKNTVTYVAEQHIQITGNRGCTHPEINNGLPYNSWTVVFRENRKELDRFGFPGDAMICGWHMTRESARKQAKQLAKILKCPIREHLSTGENQ